MAEQVNQRIEEMINELEQMKRTNLFEDDEIRDISRKRKEFEYRIQRRVKQKDDFIQYIAYELALLQDISIRRRQAKLGEKKNDIEYAIAKRLNKVFKQFIYRYQNEVEIYFEYIKFCRSVGFDHAISGIIGQMLQIHGDKPKMWLMACKWEKEEQENLETARQFLLKGLHRHPDADILYLELFEIEVLLCFKAENDEEKAKYLKRTDVVWKNGLKNINDIKFLFKLFNICLKFEADNSITESIKQEIWSRKDMKEVWSYIASKELEGYHWKEIEDYVDDNNNYPKNLQNFIGVYEEALQKFPEQSLCTTYIHCLLGLNESVCTETQKISAIKKAWYYGHDNDLLDSEMFAFGIELLKTENCTPDEKLIELLDTASMSVLQGRFVWEEKILLSISDEKKMLHIIKEATRLLPAEDIIYLWNLLLDNITSKDTIKNLYKQFQTCQSVVLMAIKAKFVRKIYEYNGLKAARDAYEDLIKMPPTQVDVHRAMIEIETSQTQLNVKLIRKYYECLVLQHGQDNVSVWMDYMDFESKYGNPQNAPTIYRRAIAVLKTDLVDVFIKEQTLNKIK